MTQRTIRSTAGLAFATFGLLLMLVVAKLANVAYTPQRSAPRRANGFLARRAIDGIAAIGWVIDRVSGVSTRARNHFAEEATPEEICC